ncbi:ethylene receptor 4-like [Panicum hallii]|uniref:ethylene receptor 4-like n=1 Tax=Panicum hallii TaxID=206008 RepID=UPI000DF4EF08|nr:ethylene receptor 4-like [Panicum hallii]
MASAAADAVLVRTARRCGGCDGREDAAVDALLQWQKMGDLLIAASLLSIPLELLYFATCAALAPLRRALLQLGTFIVMCGAYHLLNALAYDRPGSRRVLLALTFAKALGAVATSAAAVSLPVFFPRLLRIKVRESLLRTKARQLDRDLAAVRRREEAVWRVARAVARHVRDSADARAILRTTTLQLAAALSLHECAVWMPAALPHRGVLQLTHQLLPDEGGKVLDRGTRAISVRHPDVAAVLASKDAEVLRPGSVLEAATGGGLPPAGVAAAIRIPYFHGGSCASELAGYAILVLVRRGNDDHRSSSSAASTWSNQDLEVVKVVADQVAVALSHAAALEESQLIRRELAEQHGALVHARSELEAATRSRNAARGAVRDAVGRPMHAVVGLLSVMQQEAAALRPEQRLAVDAIARTSALSSTLVDHVMETLSTTTGNHDPPPPSSGPTLVARRPFDLRSLVTDAASVGGCLALCRGLGFSHHLEASSLPEWVVGDDKRVFHLLLHMVGALLSRCHGHVAGGVLSFSVCSFSNIVGDDQDRIPVPERAKFSGGNQVFVKFQVGLTRSPESDPGSSPATRPPPSGLAPESGDDTGVRLSTAMCKRIAQLKFVQMMNGNMWWASESEGFGETMTLLLRFQLQQPLNPHVPGSGTYRIGASVPHHHHHFNGLRILLADGDATSMEVTRKLLERLGCEVLPVPSAADCLSLLGWSGGGAAAAAAEPPFQMVVLDIDASGAGAAAAAANGFEVALRIRELSNACWLLILVAVAASGVDDGVRDMCRRAGVNGLIQKPVTLPALGAQLRSVLQSN